MIANVPVTQLDFQGALVLFFAFSIGHAIADFPLQGEFLSRGKNRHIPPPPLSDGGSSPRRLWIYLMSAHTLTHAGMVWIICGSPLLAFAEFVIHWAIDAMKCERVTGFESDQWLHLLTKAAYVAVIWGGLVVAA
jgi:hypothetical protein